MRKIVVTALLALFACVALAQTSSEGTLKFLGIPVDGTKEAMISQLKAKNFRYDSRDDLLYGRFNGYSVEVFVSTNHGLVDRVVVRYPETSSASVIKDEFNTLLSQFDSNEKYVGIGPIEKIPSNEDVAFEISAHDKQYEANYQYISPELFPEEEASQLRSLISQAQDMDQEAVQALIASMKPNDVEELSEEQALLILNKILSFASSHVWFTIANLQNEYSIMLYYDNMMNRPHGEDL